jgi:hypothetical protein
MNSSTLYLGKNESLFFLFLYFFSAEKKVLNH